MPRVTFRLTSLSAQKKLVSNPHALDSKKCLVDAESSRGINVKQMKTGTKIALLAALIAAVTARYWFYLTAEVALPTDRTGFVVVFLGAGALGVYALIKRTSWLGAIPANFECQILL